MGVHETRQRNVERLIESGRFNGRRADFAAAVGVSRSYLTRMLKPDGDENRKRIGEDLARQIEDKLGLQPAGWLDVDHDRAEPVPLPPQSSLAEALTTVAREIAKRSETERAMLAGALPRLATAPEQRDAVCKAVMQLLEPATDYEYTATWEELARELGAIAGAKLLSAREFVAEVDRAHGAHVAPHEVKKNRKSSP